MPAPARFHLPIDIGHFLAHHWQREALLIRGAVKHFQVPLDGDELAGLAMEEEVESRIVEEAGGRWRVSHGPFAEADFQRPPPWTLLVQAVDQWVPEVAALKQLADFLPHWRADDVMVSYATDGGSVGPHFDRYDVFLLQGQGQRLWRLGQHCDDNSPLLEACEQRVLADFDCRQQYLLSPGDLLYLPPGLAHWGIAQGECTTFSIGFRAPARQDLLARLTDQALESAGAQALFSDPGRARATRPGEISSDDIAAARAQAIALLEQQDHPAWFGELVSEPRYPLQADDGPPADLEGLWLGQVQLWRNPAARILWCEQGSTLHVFANGSACELPVTVIPTLTGLIEKGRMDCKNDGTDRNLVTFLLETGACYAE
ncbi:MAG: JmjC domain-containing protein [Parahaliea sp.]